MSNTHQAPKEGETVYKGVKVNTINLTPTWSEHLNTCLLLIENGNAAARIAGIGELKKMAQVADYYVELKNKNRIENGVG